MPLPILSKIKQDFPEIRFVSDEVFAWSPQSTTITYIAGDSPDDIAHLLHELAHALLNHNDYQRDINLIDMERAAWEYTVRELAPRYGVDIAMMDDVVQTSLDSYREWLHARSICPNCQAVGIECRKHQYRCLQCHGNWRVNEARNCELRRYKK